MLSQVGEDQIRRNRRHLIKPSFTEFPLDIELLGKPEAAMGLHAHIGRSPRGVSRQKLRHIGFGATMLPSLVECGGLMHHELGRFRICD